MYKGIDFKNTHDTHTTTTTPNYVEVAFGMDIASRNDLFKLYESSFNCTKCQHCTTGPIVWSNPYS